MPKTITIQEQAMKPLFAAITDSNLKSRHRLLLTIIWGEMINNLECERSVAFFMKATSMSKNAVIKGTEALIADGWITVVHGGGDINTNNSYKLVLSRLNLQEVKKGHLEKINKPVIGHYDIG